MRTELFLLNLAVLHYTVSSSPPRPINVLFSSVNLRNILQWSPGKGTSEDTHFTVQYAIYGYSKGEYWRAVRQCTHIARSWCDLSNETRDEEQGYYARVRAGPGGASSEWAMTRRFDPKMDTSLGPPLVSVEIEGNNAIIELKGPMRYQPNNATPGVPMATLYPQMTYNLSTHNAWSGLTHNFPVVSGPYKYGRMKHNTEYCFSAKAILRSMPVEGQSSERHCITTPPDPETGHLQRVVWAIVVPTLCMCVLLVVGYFLRNYLMGKGEKSPKNLNPNSFHPPPMNLTPGNINVILISDIKDQSPSDTDTACPKHKIADPPPGYSPHRPERPPEQDHLSVDYGFVGAATVISVPGEDEENERVGDQRAGGNNGIQPKCTAPDRKWRVAGDYSPQAKSYLSQIHRCARGPTHAQTEISTLAQPQAWSQLKHLLTRSQEGTNRGCPGLFLDNSPQDGIFQFLLNLQTKVQVGIGEEMDEKGRERINRRIDREDGNKEEETVALLTAYASQMTHIVENTPATHADQSHFLPNDYGLLCPATAHSAEKEEEGDEEEEEGTTCFNVEPETRNQVFPETVMGFNQEGSRDGMVQGEEESEDRIRGEEVRPEKGNVRLEDVFVRQASEDEAVAQRETNGDGRSGWEVEDISTKWNLVVLIDQ